MQFFSFHWDRLPHFRYFRQLHEIYKNSLFQGIFSIKVSWNYIYFSICFIVSVNLSIPFKKKIGCIIYCELLKLNLWKYTKINIIDHVFGSFLNCSGISWLTWARKFNLEGSNDNNDLMNVIWHLSGFWFELKFLLENMSTLYSFKHIFKI